MRRLRRSRARTGHGRVVQLRGVVVGHGAIGR